MIYIYPLCRGGHGLVEWAITADYYIHVQLDGNSLAFRQIALPVGFYTSIAITECCLSELFHIFQGAVRPIFVHFDHKSGHIKWHLPCAPPVGDEI